MKLSDVTIDFFWSHGVFCVTALVGALLVFVAFWIAGAIGYRIMKRIAEKDTERRDVFILLAKATKALLLIFGIVTALGTVGVDVTAVIAGMGLTGFALGFALKDMLSNAVAGFMLLLCRPFSVGEQIKVTDVEGSVKAIDLRYTTLSHNDKVFLIPNSTVLNSPVTVLSRKNLK